MTVVIDTRDRNSGNKPETPIDPDNMPLYEKRRQIYPKKVNGPYRGLKWAILALCLAIYYIVPWLRWERPEGLPQQALLIDFSHGRFYAFSLQLWAEDIFYVTGILVMSALGLFLVTALFGRLWCGYACPQTVWTDLFMLVERWFEGDRNARIKLDKSPMTFDKLWRKVGKHVSWLLIAMATGGAFVFYFQDAPELWGAFWTGQASVVVYSFVAILTFTTYSLAGTMREQVCTFMCPWPRIQGAMLDDHSLQVTYRSDRGEPRMPHKKGESWEGRGDCIDCHQCVVVCPMGIDIRNGPQLECINCGLCVDACNEIMDKVGRPKGLIAWDTDQSVRQRACGEKPKVDYFRPRTLFYGLAMLVVSAIMVHGLVTRVPLELSVLRDRNPTFVRLKNGDIRNGYTLKISNKAMSEQLYTLNLDELPQARMVIIGDEVNEVRVKPNEVATVRVFVIAHQSVLNKTSVPLRFSVTSKDQKDQVKVQSVFLSGAANARGDS